MTNEEKVNMLKKQLEESKKKLREKLVLLLTQMTRLTHENAMPWKKSSDEKKYIYNDGEKGFVFGVVKNDNDDLFFEIKMIDIKKSKTYNLESIKKDDGDLYKAAEQLYFEIDRGNLHDDEQMVNLFLDDLQ